MSLTIHSKYKYFDSIVQRANDRRQKFHFCRLPFAVNVMLNLSNDVFFPLETKIASCSGKSAEALERRKGSWWSREHYAVNFPIQRA